MDVVRVGIDIGSTTVEQVQEILEPAGKIHTVIKIDEVSNLGAAKIRIRSLLAAMNEQNNSHQQRTANSLLSRAFNRKERPTHIILAPQMSPIHFNILERAFKSEGYNVKILPVVNQSTKLMLSVAFGRLDNEAAKSAVDTVSV
jgi:hypothetical protein